MRECTDFLFARPSFAEVVGHLLDFGGTLTQLNASPTEEVADVIALRSDVAMVAEDFYAVFGRTPPASAGPLWLAPRAHTDAPEWTAGPE